MFVYNMLTVCAGLNSSGLALGWIFEMRLPLLLAGAPFPRIELLPESGRAARFRVHGGLPVASAMVYWSADDPDWRTRKWESVSATTDGDGVYHATIPAQASDWYALASDDRPVSVSSEIRHLR